MVSKIKNITLGANNSSAQGTQIKTCDKKVGDIFETSNFAQFELFPQNRKINKAQLKTIKDGLREGLDIRSEFLTVIQMLNGTRVVGDGNHRLVAARELQEEGVDVKLRYIVLKEEDIVKQEGSIGEFIQHINNDRKDWSLEDMIQYYATDSTDQERQKVYRHLVELHNSGKYFPSVRKSNWRYIAAVLSKGRINAAALKKGLFRSDVTTEDFDYYYGKISKIAQALGLVLKNNYVEGFITAWFEIKNTSAYEKFMEVFGFETFLKSLQGVEVDIKVSEAGYWYDIFATALGKISK